MITPVGDADLRLIEVMFKTIGPRITAELRALRDVVNVAVRVHGAGSDDVDEVIGELGVALRVAGRLP